MNLPLPDIESVFFLVDLKRWHEFLGDTSIIIPRYIEYRCQLLTFRMLGPNSIYVYGHAHGFNTRSLDPTF